MGDIDHAAGEFWATNPFEIVQNGENLSAYERNRFFLNVDGREFFDASFASNTDIDSDSRSAIAGDFNRDGYPDLLVASTGGGPLRLFQNQFPRSNQFLRIDLVGTKSNRMAIGSRVTLHIGDRKIIRDLFPANGFMGQNPTELLVGVGTAKSIDKITVRWPNGETTERLKVPVDQSLTIKE